MKFFHPSRSNILVRALTRPGQVVSIDPGNAGIKVARVGRAWGRPGILEARRINRAPTRGALTDGDREALEAVLQEWSPLPVVLCLPQSATISQSVELSAGRPEDLEAQIESKASELRGLSEDGIVLDYVRADTCSGEQRPYWVSYCREAEIYRWISELGLEEDRICEITTGANAVIAVVNAFRLWDDLRVYVDLGASQTTVTVVQDCRGVYAASFPIGSGPVIEALERRLDIEAEVSAEHQRDEDLFERSEFQEGLSRWLTRWHQEMVRVWGDFSMNHRRAAADLQRQQLVLLGGGGVLPGLGRYLRRTVGLDCQLWPGVASETGRCGTPDMAVCLGAGYQGLGFSQATNSLLPGALRPRQKERRTLRILWALSGVMVFLVFLCLAVGTWQKATLIGLKRDLRKELDQVDQKVRSTAHLMDAFALEYERVRPVLLGQRATTDLLRTLALLGKLKADRSFWVVLLADHESYYAGDLHGMESRLNRTNAVALQPTNRVAMDEGYILELCLPSQGETMRHELSRLVEALKESPLYSFVDVVPADARRMLVSTNVIVPGRHFAVVLELRPNAFRRPIRPKAIHQTATSHRNGSQEKPHEAPPEGEQ